MADLHDLEARVIVLERELAKLKKTKPHPESPGTWVDSLSGRFKDDPDFDEIVRLGREYRQACSDETEA